MSDKPKLKVGQLQYQSSLPRLVSVKSDVSKASSPSSLSPHTVEKLQILKPSRERNGTSAPTAKESSSLSPTAGSNLPNTPLAVVGSAPLRDTDVATVAVECKPSVEKKPSLQAKRRHDSFNLMRKKSVVNNSSTDASNNGMSDSTNDKPGEGDGTEAVERSCEVQLSGENKVDSSCSVGDAYVVTERSTNNGKNNPSADIILYLEEEEARFLRFVGLGGNY